MSASTDLKNHSTSIFKNMVVYATGTGFAKIIGFISIPIITRIYTPEDMGVLSVFVALSVLLLPFGTMKYSTAIPLPKQDALACNLAVLCFLILLLISVFSTLFLWVFAETVLQVFSMLALIDYWWLFPIVLFGAGLYEIFNGWAVREKSFKVLAKTKVYQSLMGASTKIGLGYLGFMPLGLLIGQVVGQVSGVLSLSRLFFEKFDKETVNKKRVLFLFNRYFDFPKFRLPSELLLVFSMQAPLLFSGFLFGAEVTGQLGLALMAIGLPVVLIGFSTGQAYYAEISRIGSKNPNNIYEITISVTKKLFLLSIPPFLVLFFLGPWLFQLVFGSQWQQAGIFASALSIYLLIQFISTPIVNALNVFNKQSLFLRINIVRVLGVIAIFGSSYYFQLSPMSTIYIYSFGLAAHYLFTFFTVLRVIKKA